MPEARSLTIDTLRADEKAVVVSCSGPNASRLRELGLLPGTTVRVLRRAPLGDPIQIEVGQSSLAIRIKEARSIEVEPIPPISGSPSS